MHVRQRILRRLADGNFHSGESLGAQLGISRMAVWKHLRGLREAGLEFEIVRGKGYRLVRACELLDDEQILAGVTAANRSLLGQIHVFDELESTSNWLRERQHQTIPSGTVCLAEAQSGGRGRLGRQWVSPFAANLYLSLLWRTEAGVASLGGLSLVVGIALIRCLHRLEVSTAGLKWPNDVLVNGSKLAGVLVDVTGEIGGSCAAVVGIGINVDMPDSAAGRIGQAWTDLCAVTGLRTLSRNRLAAMLLDELLPALQTFDRHGLEQFMDEWRRYDVLAGQPVDLQLAAGAVSGRACGIDDGGALLVDTATGRRRFVSGEVSVQSRGSLQQVPS